MYDTADFAGFHFATLWSCSIPVRPVFGHRTPPRFLRRPDQTGDAAKPSHLLMAFIERFSNPLVLILLFAAAVSAFTGDLPSHRHHRDVDRLSIAKGPRGKRHLLRKLISGFLNRRWRRPRPSSRSARCG